MRRSRLLPVPFAAAALLGATSPTSPQSVGSDIVVRGMSANKAHEEARKFARSQAGGPIARWRNWLCFSVQGLAPEQGAMLLSLIEKDAASVGIRSIEDRTCTWNVLIGFTADADAFAAKLVKYHPGLFRDFETVGLASHHELITLAASRPVRWLAVERTIGVVGSGSSAEEASHINDASHISTNTRGDKIAELIIVDPRKIDGVSWQQLADYISMALLTDPSMDERFADDSTIMSLFTGRDRGDPGPPGLTTEDKQLLRGYYAFDAYLPPAQQIDTIAGSLKAPILEIGKRASP